MRILITGTSYFPEFSAGTEVYMRYVSRLLAENGEHVHIACGGNDSQGNCGEPKWSRQDFAFEGIPVSRMVRNASRASLIDSYARQDPDRQTLWETLFGEIAPEIVFTVGRGPALMGDVEHIARRAGVPIVATLIHPDQVCPKGTRLDAWGHGCMRGLDARICCACVLKSCGGVVGMGDVLRCLPTAALVKLLPQSGLLGRLRTALVLPEMLNAFLRHWQELREAVSLFVAHSEAAKDLLRANGVPTSQIRFSVPGLEPRRASRRSAPTGGAVKFGFVGRLCREKGVWTLLKAWQLLPRDLAAELHLWGNPQTGEADVVGGVETLARSDRRVTFHGAFSRRQTDCVYDSIDVLVVPSEWFDNCPFVISEAFAAGLPVVGSDFGGIRSMIRHEVDGWLVPMSSAPAWAEALSRLAANPHTVRTLSQNVRPPRDARSHVLELRRFFEEAAARAAAA